MSPTRYLKQNVFTPPYRLLPLAVFAYVVVCFILHPLSPLRTGQLADPDDYMRLNEVMNWLTGQNWFDLSQPRMSPGAHTVIHWARLVDVPIALLMTPFIHLLGMQNAALMASFIVPPVLFTLLLTLAPALTRPLTGKTRANLAVVMVLFAPMDIFNFTPGRVDHHGWQILIAGFGLLALLHIVMNRKGRRYSIYAAIAFACGVWIGTEALPWLVLFCLCLAVIAAWQGGSILRNAAVFGVALPVAMLCILPLALPYDAWSSRALSWFSASDVLFALLAGGTLGFGWLLGRQTKNRKLRLAFMAALGCFAAALFCRLVPDALVGPFADYDTFDATTALENITEAQPLIKSLLVDANHLSLWLNAFLTFMHFLFLPCVALGGTLYGGVRAEKNIRALWLVQGIFLLTAGLMALFWQARAGIFMQLFAIAPLTALLWSAWDKIAKRQKGRPRFWAEILAFLVLGPLPVILLPALASDAPFASDILLFPTARSESTCPLKPAADFLAETWGYGAHPETILAGASEGPELLFRTPHSVIAGNFDVAGNKDVFDFFTSRDERKALQIARKWHAGLVLTCRNISPFYAGFGKPRFGETIFLTVGKDHKLHLTGNPEKPALIERLVNGKPPTWLKPVEIPGDNSYLLFEIRS